MLLTGNLKKIMGNIDHIWIDHNCVSAIFRQRQNVYTSIEKRQKCPYSSV